MTENIFKKQMDGISKPNSNDIKKSRELVLSSIGEKNFKIKDSSISKNKNDLKSPIKKIDGLSFSSQTLPNDTTVNPKVTIPDVIEAPVMQKVPLGGILDKNEHVVAEEPKKFRKVKSKDKIDKRETSQRAKPTKAKTLVTKAPKNKRTRTKVHKEDFRKTIAKHLPHLNKTFKKSSAIAMLVLSAFIFIFLLTSFLVLKIGDKSSFLLFLGSRLQIPALVSADGVISVDNYIKIKKEIESDEKNSLVLNNEIAKIFVLNKLYKKYKTSDLTMIQNNLAYDTEANLAPYNRIKKIKSSIEEEGNFTKVALKFGDVAQATVTSQNKSTYDFSSKIGDLEKDETSEIITTSKGYYIVHCYEKNNDVLSLSYVFIPSISLEEHLNENISSYKFWKLARY